MVSNPIFQKLKYFLFYIVFWLINSAIYFLLISIGLNVNYGIALVDSVVSNFLLAALGLSYWYPASFIPFEKNNVSKILVTYIVGGILSSVIWLFVVYNIMVKGLNAPNDYIFFFNESIAWRFLIGFLFYYLITTFYYVIIYYSKFNERIVQESKMKNLVTEAELKSLKFQINPHFIFNSLNSMSALTTIDPDKAREMILKLADFLRYTLANNEKQKNKLSDELKNIKRYLDIEKIRFEDKFEYIEEVQTDCSDVTVPNMILQPLFENAIKHAVYETLDKVTLKLTCIKDEHFLRLSVENNFDEESNNKKGAGIGLKNIQNRLELIYNQTNLLKITKENNYYKVDLFIPLENQI